MQGCVLCHSTAPVITDDSKAQKFSRTPKFWGKQTAKLRSQIPPVPLVREQVRRQVEPHYCDIKGQQQRTLGYWTRHKTGRNQALLALWLVARSGALPAVSLCLHCTWDSAVLIRWGQGCSPLLPHLCLQCSLRGLLPCFVTDLLSHFLSQHLCFLIFEMRITTSLRHFDVHRWSVLQHIWVFSLF